MNLEAVTQAIQERAQTGTPPSATIKFVLGEEGVIVLDGTKNPAKVSNENTDADCTVFVEPSVFQDILDGNENAQMAFMAGKLRIEGDMGIAMQLTQIL